MISPNDITLKRLKDAQVKGSFAIICDSVEDFLFLRLFFNSDKNYIKFKDIKAVDTTAKSLKPAKNYNNDCKFYIKYESLIELLKLREIFNIRANKFDMYLIQKRKYNPFTDDFYIKTADKTIYKIKK